MRLQRIKIEGYRSLKSVEWKPEALNVLIGPNASGKSNLLHALQLLPAVVKDELQETILRRGGMAPLLWDGKAKQLSFSLTGGEAGEVLLVRRSASTPRVRTSFPSSTLSMGTTTHRTRSAPSTARVTTCVRLRGALGSSCKAASASQSLACLISAAPVFPIRPDHLAYAGGVISR